MVSSFLLKNETNLTYPRTSDLFGIVQGDSVENASQRNERLKLLPKHPDRLLDLSQRSLGHSKQHHQTQQEPAERKEDCRAKLVREQASQSYRERIQPE